MRPVSVLAAGIVLMLVLVSSGGLAAPPGGDAAPPASQPATDARLAALEAEVAALRAEVALLGASDVRVPEPGGGVSVFLNVDGIPGSSMRDGHEDEIDALAWSWAAVHPAGAGAHARDLVILKGIDKASAPLFLACASGATIPEVKMSLRRTIEGETSDFLVITLADVRVTSIAQGIDGAHELLTLSARKVHMDYDDGRSAAGWDFAATAAG